jgi:methylated-DNA-[protein]-cysteine S-methyltransferase
MNKVYFKIVEQNKKISEIVLSQKIKKGEKLTPLEIECKEQLEEYLAGKRKKFSISIYISGTSFQQKVWNEMMKIPYGKTISYKELAEKIKKPKAYRAVANACGANKIPIIIPCHRVVATSGLGGYSAGIEIKRKLLHLEQKKSILK